MFLIRYSPLVFSLIALSGCGHDQQKPEVQIQTAPVIVQTGCVHNRPEAPPSLSQTIPAQAWANMPVGAKASAVEAQAGVRMNYEVALDAATAGCN